MKKFFIILITLLLSINVFALDVWDGTASPWTQGDGTVSDPYLIETAENLAYLAQEVNEGYQAQGMEVFKGVYFLMTDDLDLNNINWTPIGNINMSMQGYYFAGIFDGWYHSIDHLRIQTNADVCGLFAGLGGYKESSLDDAGIIRHLYVTNGNITSTGAGVGGIVGAVAGDGRIDQCSFSGTISISNSGSFCGAGGIVAAAAENSVIIQCSFHGSITASNSSFTGAAGAGGIVGLAMNQAWIDGCYNTGNVTGSALLLSVAAGIVGATLQENNITIYGCYNIGTVNANTKGGIFGMISPINPTKDETEMTVTNCCYLNTCGGTTNYGTSMTSAQMQTEEFVNQLNDYDWHRHNFVMDNGTNNGYPINTMSGFIVNEATDVTPHSATISAEIHQGNDSFTGAYFTIYKEGTSEELQVEIGTDGHVEAHLEDLDDDTTYSYFLHIDCADGAYLSSGTPHYFVTEVDGIDEISDNVIQIYPNPTSDFIFIENIEPQLVTIYSLDGKLIKTIENANVVDVRDLDKGVYLININETILKMVKR